MNRGRGSAERMLDQIGNGDYGAPSTNPRSSGSNLAQLARGNQGQGYPNAGGPGQRSHMGRPDEPQGPMQVIATLKSRIREVKKGHDEVVRALDYTKLQVRDLQERERQQARSHRLEVERLKKEAEYHKRLRQAAESRGLLAQQQVAQFERHAQGVDEAQTGLIQETQVLLSQKTELQTKLKQAESELGMQRDMVAQLAGQLDHLQEENAELRLMYDEMMAKGQFMRNNPVAYEEDDFDTDSYYVEEGPGYLGTGTGEGETESSPGEGNTPDKTAPVTAGADN